jgi:hypothetical protein
MFKLIALFILIGCTTASKESQKIKVLSSEVESCELTSSRSVTAFPATLENWIIEAQKKAVKNGEDAVKYLDSTTHYGGAASANFNFYKCKQ